MSPSANLTARINAGAPVTGAQQIQPSDVVQFDATSYAGWGSPAAIYEFPAGAYPKTWTCPAGWTDNGGSYQYVVNSIGGYKPPAVTFPGPGGIWGTWLPRLVVNGAIIDTSMAIEIRSPYLGLHETAAREESQFGGPDRGSMGPDQDNLQAIEQLAGGVAAGGVILGTGTPAAVDAGAGAAGNAVVAAPFNHKHSTTVGAAVDIGLSNTAGSGSALARANHGHNFPFSTLLGVALLASAPVDWNGMRHINVGPPIAPNDVVTLSYAEGLIDFTHVSAALAAATGNIDIGGWQIVNSGAPTTPSSLATKAYVDALSIGLDLKSEVRGASLANHTLTGALTEDGLTYVTGDRYLAKDQTNLWENGIYDVNTAGAWTRSADANSSGEVTPGMFCFVLEGTTNGKTGWALLAAGTVVLDTTNLPFTQIFGPGSVIGGAGLTQSGNTLNVVANADGSIVVNANDIQVGVLATDAQHGARGGGTQHAIATGSVNGFMPFAHWQMVNDAAYSPTNSVIPIRGAAGELLSNYFTNLAGFGAGVASGLLRAIKNSTIIATRAASGSADHTLLSTDAADGMILGDLVTTATAKLKMKAAGLFQVFADTTKIVSASTAAFAIFGDVDAGGGQGVFNLHDASTGPTGNPSDGALIHSSHGAVRIVNGNGVRTWLSPQGEGSFPVTQLEFQPRVGVVVTTTNTPTLILALTIPSQMMLMEAEVHVMGMSGDLSFDSRMIVRCRRILAGVVNITSFSYTGIADLNDFVTADVTGAAGGVNVNDLELKVKGTNANTITWMAEAKVTLFKP